MVQKTTKATYQVLVGTVLGRVINLAALVIVTPILGPDGFGQLLVVGIITALFDTFLDIGFENYYIIKVNLKSNDQASKDKVIEIENAIFKLRLYSNLILFTLQIAASYLLVGILFDSPIDDYLRILALNYLAAIAGKINEVRMKKRLEFGIITWARFYSNIISALARVLLVVAGYGLLGWAGGLVLGTFIYNFSLLRYGNFKPKLIKFSKDIRKEILWFAKHSWLMGIGQYLHSQSSNWLLKVFNTISEIGLVQFSSSYTLDVHSGMFASQAPLLFSYYSNHKDEPKKILNAISQMAAVGYLMLGIPLIMGGLFAEPIINFMFGQKWLPAVTVLTIYCCYTFIRISYSPGIGIHNAIGKLKVGTYVTYIQLIITVLTLLVLGYYDVGINGFAFALVILNIIGENLKVFSGLYFLHIFPWHYFGHNVRMYLTMILIIGIGFLVRLFYPIHGVIDIALVGFFLYFVFFILLWYIHRAFCKLMLQKLFGLAANSKVSAIAKFSLKYLNKLKS